MGRPEEHGFFRLRAREDLSRSRYGNNLGHTNQRATPLNPPFEEKELILLRNLLWEQRFHDFLRQTPILLQLAIEMTLLS